MTTHSRRAVMTAAGITAGAALTWNPLPGLWASAHGGTVRAGRTPMVDEDPDVVFRTSFEDSNETFWLSDSTTFDTAEHFTGGQSLKYSRTDSTSYTIVKHAIPFEVGQAYQISGFIKTSGINAIPRYGASFALEAYDATGRWIRGAYAVGSVSTDWELRTATYEEIPANAATLYVCFYIYRGQLGSAWFDEVAVRRPSPAILTTSLRYPNYRGLIVPDGSPDVELNSSVNIDKVDPSSHTLHIALTNAAGANIDQVQTPIIPEFGYTYPTAQLATGHYSVTASVVANGNGAVVTESSWQVEKVATAPETYIDAHGRLIKSGQLHFPIGFYASTIADSIPDLAGTPFNTLLSYRPPSQSELDLAADRGIGVIYSLAAFYYDTTGAYYRPPELVTEADEVPVITARVTQYRDHPALLAWYLSDELNVEYYGQRMIAHQEAVVAADPWHPTLAVSPTALQPETYQRATDALGVDNYPLTGATTDDLTTPGRLATAAASALPGRGLWHVPQFFDWTHYGRPGRFPTEAELRSMCWQFMVAGATGLLIYQLPLLHTDDRDDPSDDATDRFPELIAIASSVANEIIARVPIMLAPERATSAEATPVEGLFWTSRRQDDTDYIIAVSGLKESRTMAFTASNAMSVEVVDEARTLPVGADGSFSDTFAALALHLYRIVPPTFASLAELTRTELDTVGGPGHRGVADAAAKILARAETRAQTNATEAEEILGAYRDLVRTQDGRLLQPDSTQNLLRLSTVVLDQE